MKKNKPALNSNPKNMKTNNTTTTRQLTLLAALTLAPIAYGDMKESSPDDPNKDSITKVQDTPGHTPDTEESRRKAKMEAQKSRAKAKAKAEMEKENKNPDSNKDGETEQKNGKKKQSNMKHDKHVELTGAKIGSEDGPNGGKILTDANPPVELLINADRQVMITFLDEDGKMVAPKEQALLMLTGKRADPTKIQFKKTITGYLSTNKLPEGDLIPAVIQLKTDPDAEQVNIRMNINFYAHDYEGHDHAEDGKKGQNRAEDGHEGHNH